MATFVQSRFAGLKIEDDDYPPSDSRKKQKSPGHAVKNPEPAKKTKKIAANGAAKKKKSKPQATEEQWEMWKKKDEEMVDGNFEADLTQAILLSKLEFEQEKTAIKLQKKPLETEKKLEAASVMKENKAKKQKKKNVMSLDQFNHMVRGDDQKPDTPQESPERTVAPDKGFFNRLDDEALKEYQREKYKDQVAQRQPPSDEIINRIQFAEALERKDQEIAKLGEEVTRLKEELLLVKSRNKKLCHLMLEGEMKDKAQMLVELNKMREAQAELTSEVATLAMQLEQERSKNPDPKAKDKRYSSKPRSVRFDESAVVPK